MMDSSTHLILMTSIENSNIISPKEFIKPKFTTLQ